MSDESGYRTENAVHIDTQQIVHRFECHTKVAWNYRTDKKSSFHILWNETKLHKRLKWMNEIKISHFLLSQVECSAFHLLNSANRIKNAWIFITCRREWAIEHLVQLEFQILHFHRSLLACEFQFYCSDALFNLYIFPSYVRRMNHSYIFALNALPLLILLLFL